LHIRLDRVRELRRIFGDNVEVIDTTFTDPDAVESIIVSIDADAVVIDVVAPAVLVSLVAALRRHTLLRPIFDQVRTGRGEPQPVFAGYARLTADGDLESIEDGACASPEQE
jgi:hypothetical protein